MAMTRRTRLPQKNGGPSAGSSRRRLRAPSGALDGVLAHLPERWQNARAAVASGTRRRRARAERTRGPAPDGHHGRFWRVIRAVRTPTIAPRRCVARLARSTAGRPATTYCIVPTIALPWAFLPPRSRIPLDLALREAHDSRNNLTTFGFADRFGLPGVVDGHAPIAGTRRDPTMARIIAATLFVGSVLAANLAWGMYFG